MSMPMPVLDVSGTTPVPFWRLMLVELRKTVDTRSGFWLLMVIALLVALVEGFILVATLVQDTFVVFGDFAYTAGGITSLLLPVLAIMLVTAEWSQRTAMVSFALEPRRIRVVLAKVAVGLLLAAATVLLMLVVGLVCTLVCEIVQPELTAWDVEADVLVGFALSQALTMLVGFAFAALLLNTPAAIVLFFLYWYVLPIVLAVVGSIRAGLGDALSWVNLRVALEPVFAGELDTAGEWGRLVVSAVLWIALPFAAGVARILRAEVK